MANRRTQIVAGALTALLVAVGLTVGTSPGTAEASAATKKCLQTESYDRCYVLRSANTVRVGDVATAPVKWDDNVSAVKYRWYRCTQKVSGSNNYDAPSVSIPSHCKSAGVTSQTRAVTTSDLGLVLAVYSEGFYKGATNKVFAPVSKSGVEGSKLDKFTVEVPKKVAPKQTINVKVKTDKISPAPSKVEIAFRDCAPNTRKKSCGAFETGAAKHVAPTFGEVEVVVTVRRGNDSKSTTKLVLVDSSAPVAAPSTTAKPAPSTTAKPTSPTTAKPMVSTTKPATGALVPLSKFDFTVPKSVGVGQQFERTLQWNGVTGATSVTQFRLCYANLDGTEDCDAAVSNTYKFTPKREGTVFIEVTASRKEGSKTLTATKSKYVVVNAAPAAGNAPGFKTAWISGTPVARTQANAMYTLDNADSKAFAVTATWNVCPIAQGAGCSKVGTGTSLSIPDSAVGKALQLELTLKDAKGKAVAKRYVATKAVTAARATQPPATRPPATKPPATQPPATQPKAAPKISGLAVSGAVAVGSELSATATITGRPAPSVTYEWMRCTADQTECVSIDGATKAKYTLVAEDLASGHVVGVMVTAANGVGSPVKSFAIAGTTSAPPTTSTTAPTTTTTAPTTSTTAPTTSTTAPPSTGSTPTLTSARVTGLSAWTVGQTATVTATATGSPTPTIVLQWYRCTPIAGSTRMPSWPEILSGTCAAVSGATTASYTATVGDVGKQVFAVVTAQNSVGAASPLAMYPSTSTNPILAAAATAPPVTQPPTTNTTAPPITVVETAPKLVQVTASGPSSWAVGGTMTVTATATGSPAPKQEFQWYRCAPVSPSAPLPSVLDNTCTAIASATTASYTATSADVDKVVAVVVAAKNGVGTPAVRTYFPMDRTLVAACETTKAW